MYNFGGKARLLIAVGPAAMVLGSPPVCSTGAALDHGRARRPNRFVLMLQNPAADKIETATAAVRKRWPAPMQSETRHS
jgi:hypothetical protein